MYMKHLKHISILFVAVLALLLLLTPKAEAATVASGTCGASGDNLQWSLDDQGVLTIYGIGEMKNWTRYNNLSVFDHYEVNVVIIEKGVTSIGDFAFYECGVDSVTIPSTVTYIGKEALSCSGLVGIWVDDNSLSYVSDGRGVLFNKNKTELIQAPGRLSGVYEVPDSVIAIGNGAFYGCSSLTYVTIGDGVVSIGNSAFYCCYGLTSVTIPDSVISIGESVFESCNKLKTIELGSNVETIGKNAFVNCSALTSVTIPNSVKTIGEYAFQNCKKLTSVILPDNILVVSNYAFYNCAALTSITIPDNVTTIGNYAFGYCSKLSSVAFGENLVTIGDSAFRNCIGLSLITISNRVETIGGSAFSGCTGLTSITIPDSVDYIGWYTFKNCTKLEGIWVDGDNKSYSSDAYGVLFDKNKEELIQAPEKLSGTYSIPDGVVSIHYEAFVNCKDLISVTIPDGVASIGGAAFKNCTDLTSVTIPDSVSTIYSYAFYGCTGLEKMLFAGLAPAMGNNILYDVTATAYYPVNDESWTEDMLQNYGGTITWVAYSTEKTGRCGEGVYFELDDGGVLTIYVEKTTRNALQGTMTSAPWKLLYGDQIKTVVIEEGVLNVTEGAFEGCGNLETVTVAKTVTSIGSNAFADCANLTSVTFAGSAPTIDSTAFTGTDATLYYPADDESWDDEIKDTVGDTTIFVPVGGITKFDIDAARMILGNSLEFQFGVAKDKFADTTGVYAVVEKGAVTKIIPASQWSTAGQYWAIVYDGLAAKEMADEISVTIYNADGQAISNAKTDSARGYVMRNIDSQNAKCRTMMVDMLNYGAAAQIRFDYNTEDLANNQLTEAQRAWGTQTLTATANNRVAGANYMGTRLILESRIQMQVAFSGMDRTMYAVYSYTDHFGNEQNVTVKGEDFIEVSGLYGIELSKLVYADARTLVTVRVYNADGTLYSGTKDSIQSYVNRSGETDPLFEALMKFTDSARAYLHQ